MEAISYDELLGLFHQLQTEFAEVRANLASLQQDNRSLLEENVALRAEIERLKGGPPAPPAWVKASRPASQEKNPRKKCEVNYAGFG